MESNAKKQVKVTSEKLKSRLASEKDRPKTSTFNEAQRLLVVLINPMFQQFFEVRISKIFFTCIASLLPTIYFAISTVET